MSDFMPVERVELMKYGALTAINLTEDSVIALELKPNWRLTPEDVALLRQRCQAAFPNHPVMVIDSEKLSLKVIDIPQTEAQLERDQIRAAWTAISVATLCIQLAIGLRFALRRRR